LAGSSLGRRNKNVAAVALANKNARIVWALLAHDRDYEPDYGSGGMNTGFPPRRSPLVIEGPPAAGAVENPAT
jgi:hypothetical protein